MRKTIWKQKVSKQATRALFLAKYLLKNTSEEISENAVTSKFENAKESKEVSED
jgi:hypothetical protein